MTAGTAGISMTVAGTVMITGIRRGIIADVMITERETATTNVVATTDVTKLLPLAQLEPCKVVNLYTAAARYMWKRNKQGTGSGWHPTPTMKTTQILAGQLFDPHKLQFLPNQVITISRGLVLDVKNLSDVELAPDAIDLRHLTVLPGFVDVHVHLFLHSYEETSWDDQLTKESLVERVVRATVHARKTLMAGFTTVRDLGTEGAGDADLYLRKCMAGPNPIIHGPRYFVANRAIVCSGSYGPRSYINVHEDGREGVTGAQVVDGTVECIRAVRQQIGGGADWIKIYADYRTRSRMAPVAGHLSAKSIPTFNQEELKAMVDTAHSSGVKVAVHAQSTEAIRKLLPLGVDSIEHGHELGSDESLMRKLAFPPDTRTTTKWVPTLAVFYKSSLLSGSEETWNEAMNTFKTALKIGMENIAVGGDTGAFPHGENALEMKLMVRLGANWKKVLRWATLGGWECIRPMEWETLSSTGDNTVRFGAVLPGWAADLVGVAGNLETDFEQTVDDVKFVMKGGKIFKRDGQEFPDGYYTN